jgi:hypothetical protein
MAGRVIPLATSEQTLAAAATAFLAHPSPTVRPGVGRAQPRVNAETGDRRLFRAEVRAGSGRHTKRFLVCVKRGT